MAATIAWPAPVPDRSLDDQTRFEELVATTPKVFWGSNLLHRGQLGVLRSGSLGNGDKLTGRT